MNYKCNVCGWVYDEEAQNAKFDELPEGWTCPMCGAMKDKFEKI